MSTGCKSETKHSRKEGNVDPSPTERIWQKDYLNWPYVWPILTRDGNGAVWVGFRPAPSASTGTRLTWPDPIQVFFFFFQLRLWWHVSNPQRKREHFTLMRVSQIGKIQKPESKCFASTHNETTRKTSKSSRMTHPRLRHGQQDPADDTSLRLRVLPPRPAVVIQSGPQGGPRPWPFLQVHSLQARRGLSPRQGLFQARQFHRSQRVQAPPLPDQRDFPCSWSPSHLAFPGPQLLGFF